MYGGVRIFSVWESGRPGERPKTKAKMDSAFAGMTGKGEGRSQANTGFFNRPVKEGLGALNPTRRGVVEKGIIGRNSPLPHPEDARERRNEGLTRPRREGLLKNPMREDLRLCRDRSRPVPAIVGGSSFLGRNRLLGIPRRN